MKIACHQPNFLPFMGFFYKIYLADVYTVSNSVQFSNAYRMHNANYINLDGKKHKISLPLSSRSGIIKDILLAPQYSPQSLLALIKHAYSKAPFFDLVYNDIKSVLEKYNPGDKMWELNFELLSLFFARLGIAPKIYLESDLDLPEDPNDAIIDICNTYKGDVYLSGYGGKDYLKIDLFKENGIDVVFTEYQSVEYETKNGFIPNLSAIDYFMYIGYKIPESWKK